MTVLDEQSQVVATSIGGAKQQVQIDNVIRWQPLNAYLYQAVVELVDGDVVEDSYSEPFGIRTIGS